MPTGKPPAFPSACPRRAAAARETAFGGSRVRRPRLRDCSRGGLGASLRYRSRRAGGGVAPSGACAGDARVGGRSGRRRPARRARRCAILAKNERLVTPPLGKRGCAPPTALVDGAVIPATGRPHQHSPGRSVTNLSFLAIFCLDGAFWVGFRFPERSYAPKSRSRALRVAMAAPSGAGSVCRRSARWLSVASSECSKAVSS